MSDKQSQCASLRQEIIDLKLNFDQTERRNEEERTSEERKHTEEVAFLKKTNAQLKVVKNRRLFVRLNYLQFSFLVSIGGNYYKEMKFGESKFAFETYSVLSLN